MMTTSTTGAQEAFEGTVTKGAGVLEAELAAAGDDRAARRAAWVRYGDVQAAAGDAFRAATGTMS